MKVLLTVNMVQDHVKQMEDLGYEILFEDERRSDFQGDYSDVDILITYNAFPGLTRQQLPNLKWIQLTSIGFDQVSPEFQDVMISNNHGGYSPQIGEWVVGMILAMEKRLHQIYDNQRDHKWRMLMNLTSLKGKTIAFIGTGTLARESVKRLAGFEVDCLGVNRSGHPVEGFDETHRLADIKQVLARADHVINCLPATPDTIGLIDGEFILAMKPGAHLHNISRGLVLVEKDLIRYHDHLGMIALDVFETEPLPDNSPLWQLPNIIISSHNSWVDQHIARGRFELFYDNLQRFQSNQPLRNIINYERGY